MPFCAIGTGRHFDGIDDAANSREAALFLATFLDCFYFFLFIFAAITAFIITQSCLPPDATFSRALMGILFSQG